MKLLIALILITSLYATDHCKQAKQFIAKHRDKVNIVGSTDYTYYVTLLNACKQQTTPKHKG